LETEFDSVAVVETLVAATPDAEDSALFHHPEIVRNIHAITDGNHRGKDREGRKKRRNIQHKCCVTTPCGVNIFFFFLTDLTNSIQ
jgi:hypothetical protein